MGVKQPTTQEIPEDLKHLHPDITKFLLSSPALHELLRSHPSILKAGRMTKEHIQFLTRNYRRHSSESGGVPSRETTAAAAAKPGLKITISNLHPDTTEDELRQIFMES